LEALTYECHLPFDVNLPTAGQIRDLLRLRDAEENRGEIEDIIRLAGTG
jgi:hypothetical protein